MNEDKGHKGHGWITVSLALIAGLALGALGWSLYGGGNRRAVETIVHNYLLEHPEILPQAMDRLQQREVSAAIRQNRATLDQPYGSAWQGSAKPDVTVIEYYDYACGYCRRSVEDVQKLVAADPGVRVIYRELPVLAPESERAALVSLAAAQNGQFVAFHKALFAAGPPDDATLARVATQFGLNPRLAPTPEMRAELTRNHQIAQQMNMTGTPAWIIGDRVYAGQMTFDQLQEAVAAARKAAGATAPKTTTP